MEEKSQIGSLTLHLKELEKEIQTTPKFGVHNRADIVEIENRK